MVGIGALSDRGKSAVHSRLPLVTNGSVQGPSMGGRVAVAQAGKQGTLGLSLAEGTLSLLISYVSTFRISKFQNMLPFSSSEAVAHVNPSLFS